MKKPPHQQRAGEGVSKEEKPLPPITDDRSKEGERLRAVVAPGCPVTAAALGE
jgi:hypothetical protein